MTFKDDGKTFVKVLKERHSSFGSLGIDFDAGFNPISNSNLELLVKVDLLKELRTSNLHKERFHLPFLANVKALRCTIVKKKTGSDDFKALEIMTSDLSLKMMLDDGDKCDELAISFFDRVAELGHFERLTFATGDLPGYEGDDFDNFSAVVEALIRAIRANTKLSYLNLSDTCYKLDWTVHFEAIFLAMEEH